MGRCGWEGNESLRAKLNFIQRFGMASRWGARGRPSHLDIDAQDGVGPAGPLVHLGRAVVPVGLADLHELEDLSRAGDRHLLQAGDVNTLLWGFVNGKLLVARGKEVADVLVVHLRRGGKEGGKEGPAHREIKFQKGGKFTSYCKA